MRYKGIELREGTEAELLVNIEAEKEFDDEQVDGIEDEVLELFWEDDYDVYIEIATEKLVQVRCDEITFDREGVGLLTYIYDKLVQHGFEDARITIGVHVDDEWFRDENGNEYNEDAVSLEDFCNNLDY